MKMNMLSGSYRIMILTAVFVVGGFILQSSNTYAGGAKCTPAECKKNKKLADKYCQEHPEDTDCSKPRGDGLCPSGGDATGRSAQGFYGIGGTNPVPAGYTCASGTLTSAPNKPNCDVFHPPYTCKNSYTYSTHVCGFVCKP